MHPIQPPITSETPGPEVANLQTALLFLISSPRKDIFEFKAYESPNRPTQEELDRLTEKLGSEQTTQLFGDATKQLLLYFQIQQSLGDKLGGEVEKTTAARLNELLKQFGAFDTDTGFLVRGRVTDTQGRPLVGHKVVAYDQDLRVRQRLGDAQTNGEGYYEIPYRIEDAQQAESETPAAADLVVEVLPRNSPTPLTTSDIRFHAKRVETIDLTVDLREEIPTEFARVSAAITPLLVGQGEAGSNLPPFEIMANDVAFIVREAELDEPAVQAWAEAARFARTLATEASDPPIDVGTLAPDLLLPLGWRVFYGFIRATQASTLDAVLQEQASTWQSWQERNVESRLVEHEQHRPWFNLVQMLERLRKLRTLDWVRSPNSPLASVASVMEIPLPRQLAERAADIFLRHGFSDPDAFVAMTAGPIEANSEEAAVTRRWVRTVRLHGLTDGDLGLMRTLNHHLGGDGHDIERLAAAPVSDWRRWCETSTRLADGDAKLSLPFQMQAHAELQYPMVALGARVESIAEQLPGEAARELRNAVADHADGMTRLIAGDLEHATVSGLSETARDLGLNLGRFLRLGVTLEIGSHLWKAGVKTPAQMVRMGSAVVQTVLDGAAPVAYIVPVVTQAQMMLASSQALFNQMVSMRVIPLGLGDNGTKISGEVQEAFPNLRGFFGDLDQCVCRPCESVLGLPAYLVDLLNFLTSIPARNPGVATALDELRVRRPEILSRLRLGCVEAETEILHIDIVIEILQHAIGTSADLTTQAYPWSLPYLREVVETKAWLGRLSLSRASWMAQMQALYSDADFRGGLAAERLGLSRVRNTGGGIKGTWSLVTVSASGNNLWQLYGFKDGSSTDVRDPASGVRRTGVPGALLAIVSILLDRTGLELGELRQALAARFVKEGATLNISNLDQCKTSEMFVSGLDAAGAVLDRLHRFVRLWRATPGRSMPVLDSALRACRATPAEPFEDVLIRFGRIVAIQERLNLPLETVLALFHPLHDVLLRGKDPGSTESLYDVIFRSDRLSEAQKILIPALPATPATPPTFPPGETLVSRVPVLALGLQCSPMDLASWIDTGTAAGPSYRLGNTFDYANVTALYRRHQLSTALDLSPEELSLFLSMTGTGGFSTTVTTFCDAMEPFLDAYTTYRISGLTMAQTAQVLLSDGEWQGVPRSTDLEPDWGDIKRTLVSLRVALLQLESPTGDEAVLSVATEAALGAWVDAQALLNIVAALRNKGGADVAGAKQVLQRAVPGVPGAQGEPAVLFDQIRVNDLFAPGTTVQRRLQEVLLRALRIRREAVLRMELSRWSGMEESVLDQLLARDLKLESANGSFVRAVEGLLDDGSGGFLEANSNHEAVAHQGKYVDWMYRLRRFRSVVSALKVEDHNSFLSSLRHAALDDATRLREFAWVNLIALHHTPSQSPRWLEWQAVVATAQLLRSDAAAVQGLPQQLSGIAGAAAVTAATLKPMAGVWKVAVEDLWMVMQKIIPNSRSWRDPWHWWRAGTLLEQGQRLGASPAQIIDLVEAMPTAFTSAAAKALALAKRSSDADTVTNDLKSVHRDALLAGATFVTGKTTEQLYAHYLVDLHMAPCMRTTLILHAIASVQLFVHRILFGLEPGIGAHPGDELAMVRRQWRWMAQYRVWEANRKVFLYPENWLFPELRDDKSHAFQALESTMGQSELTQEVAEQAFARYLDTVAQAGQIRILGMFDDRRTSAPTNGGAPRVRRDLYVVGRTPQPPYRYFWRVCHGFGLDLMEWTPWRRIDLDIQSDHVVPFVLQGDFYIAWPQFERLSPAGNRQGWDLKMAWARWIGREWSAIELSRDGIRLDLQPFDDERTGFAFRCKAEANRVRLLCFARASDHRLAGDQKSQISPPPSIQPFSGLDVGDRLFVNNFNWSWMVYDNQGSISFPLSLDPADVGTVLGVTADVWIKARHETSEGFVHIDPLSQIARTIQIHYSLGSHTFNKSLNDTRIMILTRKDANLSIPEVKVRATFAMGLSGGNSAGQSDELPLDETPVGKRQTVFGLKLVIVPSPLPTLTELGMAPADSFVPVAEFGIDRGGNSNLYPPRSGEPPLRLLRGCRVVMNGYVGDERAMPIALPTQPPLTSLSPFAPPYSIDPDMTGGRNFTLVGAASNATADGLPPVWSYFDGRDACILDLDSPRKQRTPSGAFDVYASGYAVATEFRARIGRGDSEFVQLGNEPIDFSAAPANLPTVTAAGNTTFWQEQGQGKRGFDLRLPYAGYNWEVFFHTPLFIAAQLSKQGRYWDAERWLRLVLDPTSGDSGTGAQRFLRFRPFKDINPANTVSSALTALAQAKRWGSAPGASAVRDLIEQWRLQPFLPFLIARQRPLAFLWRTVFAYLDNLLAWADDLFRLDTRESINEATQLYVLAAQMLGPRPKAINGRAPRTPITYDQAQRYWDEFANAWLGASGNGASGNRPNYHVGPDLQEPPADGADGSMGMLYFCIPINPKLNGYWDLVEDRLFNIRHCRNIDGVTRDLPLTEAPIDPELLVRATAAGLDIADVLRGLYAPPHTYRSQTLLARALDMANETKALGGALLSAMEKRDAERLALLRSTNEIALLQRMKEMRLLQITEAQESLEALRVSRQNATRRYEHFQQLLGKANKAPGENTTAPDEAMLNNSSNDTSGFRAGFGGLGLIEPELAHIEHLGHANGWMLAAGVSKGIAGTFHTSSAFAEFSGEKDLAAALKALGTAASTVADVSDLVSKAWQNSASKEQLRGSHIRRRDEWAHQSNQVLAELRHIDRQKLAQKIRLSIAEKERDNQQAQIEQARDVDEFLHTKFSNADLYEWMRGELSALHRNAHRMALDLARRAERAVAEELGTHSFNMIRNDYWSQRQAGLLAGERLHQDLKKLELLFLEQNKREFELTKHISLRRLNPEALLKLIFTGECAFDVPEWLFDLDTPGHYLRRIKTVSLSVPCVVGPQASIHCKLTLMGSETRKDKLSGDYTRKPDPDDPRFTVRYGATESIVTSTGRDDSGLFETSLRDDRYLPFEGAGAISHWQLKLLDREVPQFDHKTISDVILHMRYTARDGGKSLQTEASNSLTIEKVDRPFDALLSARHDFPTEWAQAVSTRSEMTIPISDVLTPYWVQARRLSIKGVALWDAAAQQFSEVGEPVSIGPGQSSSVSIGRVHTLPDGEDRFIRLRIE